MFPSNYFGPMAATVEVVDSGAVVSTLAAAVQNALAGQNLYPQQGAIGNSSLRLVAKDSYDGNRALVWYGKNYPNVWPSDLTGWTVTLSIKPAPDNPDATTITPVTTDGSVIVAAGSGQSVQVTLSAAQTGSLPPAAGNYGYVFDVVATNGSDRATLVSGAATVIANVTA